MKELDELKALIERIEQAEKRVLAEISNTEILNRQNSCLYIATKSYAGHVPDAVVKLHDRALELVKNDILITQKEKELKAKENLLKVIDEERRKLCDTAARTAVALGGLKC